MRSIFIAMAALFAAQVVQGNALFERLRPGITRAELRAQTPVPLEERGGKDVYVNKLGNVEFVFRNEVLFSATSYNSNGSASEYLYSTFEGVGRTDPESRRAYLRKASYRVLPTFGGESVRTGLYDGLCYEVDGQYIVIEPITPLAGASGFFADKAARVLLVQSDGSERLLYRACDHWQELRPPSLSVAESQHRVSELVWAASGPSGKSIPESLGPSDSIMGSGRCIDLYYLPEELLVVGDARTYSSNWNRIHRVGNDSITLKQWLTRMFSSRVPGLVEPVEWRPDSIR